MLRMKNVLLTAGIALVVLTGAGCARKPATAGLGSLPQETLAQVGNQKITTRDLSLALAGLPDRYQMVAGTAKGKRQILNNLIRKNLLVQEAERQGFQQNEELKRRIREYQTKAAERIRKEIADLQESLRAVDRQAYEDLLLSALNDHLKQDTGRQASISDTAVKAYYNDYVRKLKQLNPAATAPALVVVSGKIRAVLVEEQLLKELEQKNRVNVHEDVLHRLFGEEQEQANTPAASAQANSGVPPAAVR